MDLELHRLVLLKMEISLQLPSARHFLDILHKTVIYHNFTLLLCNFLNEMVAKNQILIMTEQITRSDILWVEAKLLITKGRGMKINRLNMQLKILSSQWNHQKSRMLKQINIKKRWRINAKPQIPKKAHQKWPLQFSA